MSDRRLSEFVQAGIVCVLLVAISSTCVQAAPLIGPGEDDFDREVGTITERRRTINYEFFRPPNHDQPGKLPLMVYLHGFTDGLPEKQSRLNDTMRDLVHTTQRDNASRGDVCQLANSCEQFDDDFAAYLLVPKIPVVEGWDTYHRHLDLLLDDLLGRYDVDTNRLYLSGFSNGAFMIPNILRQYPDTYSAAISLSGGQTNPASSVVDALQDVPSWFFHGTADGVVDPQGSVDLAGAVQAAGGDAQLTLVPGGHNAGYEFAFRDANNEVYPWLFRQTAVPEPTTATFCLAVVPFVLAARARQRL